MSNTNTPKKRKFIFGRNIFTIVFIALVLLITGVIIYTISNYITVGNEGNVTPFISNDGGLTEEEQNNIINMEAKDFNKFDISFICTDYNVSKKEAAFEIRLWKNENTGNVTTVTSKVCMASDWVGFCKYSSGTRNLKMADTKETAMGSTAYRQTYTISSIIDYPAKANTWPIKVTVDKPDFYLYLKYSYTVSGSTKNEIYCLHYSYGEFEIQSGGLRA